MPEAVGQLNMYLNYYESEVNDEEDNKPIGIILCTDKDALTVEYALGGLSSNIFASKYTYYIPEKEALIAELEKVINNLMINKIYKSQFVEVTKTSEYFIERL